MKLRPAAVAPPGGGDDGDGEERDRTQAEIDAIKGPLEQLMHHMGRLVRKCGPSPVTEILVGILLRVGMHPTRIWNLVKERLPDECQEVELEVAVPANKLPL